jgi:predicted nucleic acid-binding protein
VNACFDTSVLVKLYLAEDGSERAMTLFTAAEVAIVNALAFVEVRAALAAAVRAGRLHADAFATAEEDLQTLRETFAVAAGDLVFVSWDADLSAAAARAGLATSGGGRSS